jgi:trehalose 6-phosphate phosphatase
MVGVSSPKIPALDHLAVLLDVDGTLLDIAATPEQVIVPDSLRETLARLSVRTGGALAFVSGRPLDELDRLFAPLRFPAVAGHGAEFRPSLGAKGDYRRAGTLDSSLKEQFAALAETTSGVLIEDKGYALAVHYRSAPEQEAAVREAVSRICADRPSFEVLPGKYVLEVKDSGFNKASGVRDLMARPPFVDRRPIFLGDDATDEFVFAIMPEFDGLAFSVGDAVRGADGHFEGPAAVRSWLAELARGNGVAAPEIVAENAASGNTS